MKNQQSTGWGSWQRVTGKTSFQLDQAEFGPSQRNLGGHSFLNRVDREQWHLKVIADREAHRAKNGGK